MLDFLPDKILTQIKTLNLLNIGEIRIRANKPITVCVNGKYKNLFIADRFIPGKNDIEQIILKLTKHTLYAYQETIKQGYIIGEHGERVGLCGKCVTCDGEVKMINEISSLNIRLPKEVKGVADFIESRIYRGKIKNLLVISPPGMGKTTLIRDLARIISDNYKKNVLIVDEKGEISGGGVFDVGQTTDVIIGCDKSYGFTAAVNNMCPDVIIVDELTTEKAVDGAILASLSGVKIAASCHGADVSDVVKKPVFRPLIDNKIIEYCVTLSNRAGVGTVEEVIKL